MMKEEQNIQKLFKNQYEKDVNDEANFILATIQSTAKINNYEPDVFTRHVLNRIKRLAAE